MITVDGGALTIDAVVRAAREREAVALDPGVRARMRPAREVVDRLDREGAVVYGVTTGFGALADRAVDPADRALLQRSVVLSHAAGIGSAPRRRGGPRDDPAPRAHARRRALRRPRRARRGAARAARRGHHPLGAGARLARRFRRPGAACRGRHRAARCRDGSPDEDGASYRRRGRAARPRADADRRRAQGRASRSSTAPTP